MTVVWNTSHNLVLKIQHKLQTESNLIVTSWIESNVQRLQPVILPSNLRSQFLMACKVLSRNSPCEVQMLQIGHPWNSDIFTSKKQRRLFWHYCCMFVCQCNTLSFVICGSMRQFQRKLLSDKIPPPSPLAPVSSIWANWMISFFLAIFHSLIWHCGGCRSHSIWRQLSLWMAH